MLNQFQTRKNAEDCFLKLLLCVQRAEQQQQQQKQEEEKKQKKKPRRTKTQKNQKTCAKSRAATAKKDVLTWSKKQVKSFAEQEQTNPVGQLSRLSTKRTTSEREREIENGQTLR